MEVMFVSPKFWQYKTRRNFNPETYLRTGSNFKREHRQLVKFMTGVSWYYSVTTATFIFADKAHGVQNQQNHDLQVQMHRSWAASLQA